MGSIVPITTAYDFAAVYLSRYSICAFSALWSNATRAVGYAAMISNVVGDGRLLSLRGFEWLMLIAGGLVGTLILMF